MTSQGTAAADPGKDRVLAFIKANRLAEAKVLAEALCQTHGGDAEVWHLRGVVCGSSGQTGEAEACFRRAVELRPDYGKALRNLTAALRNQGKTVLTRSKKSRALALLHANLLEESRRLFEEIFRIDPLDAESWRRLGIILSGQPVFDFLLRPGTRKNSRVLWVIRDALDAMSIIDDHCAVSSIDGYPAQGGLCLHAGWEAGATKAALRAGVDRLMSLRALRFGVQFPYGNMRGGMPCLP